MTLRNCISSRSGKHKFVILNLLKDKKNWDWCNAADLDGLGLSPTENFDKTGSRKERHNGVRRSTCNLFGLNQFESNLYCSKQNIKKPLQTAMPNLGGGGGGRTPRFLSTFSPTQSLHCSEQSWKIRPVITLLQASDDKNGCSPTLWQTRGPSFHSWVTEQPTWNLTLWGLLVSWPQNQNKSFWFRYSSKQSDESEMSPASFVMRKICNVRND